MAEAFVHVDIGCELLEQLPSEECATCGHQSVVVALAVLTMNRMPQSLGIYRRCAEGCDDDPAFESGEHDSSPCSIDLIAPDHEEDA